jgi:hypothetical protein
MTLLVRVRYGRVFRAPFHDAHCLSMTTVTRAERKKGFSDIDKTLAGTSGGRGRRGPGRRPAGRVQQQQPEH